MMKRLMHALKSNPVLTAAAIAAAGSACAVPPDASYIGYIDIATLSCLFSLLTVVAALRNAGAFEAIARVHGRFVTSNRATVLSLVLFTLALSMFATNDMALVFMLPLSAVVLLFSRRTQLLPLTFTLQSLAANLGGMILPFGNPQNLFLYQCFHIDFGAFLFVMAKPFALSVALVVLCCIALVKNEGGHAGSTQTVVADELPVERKRNARSSRNRVCEFSAASECADAQSRKSKRDMASSGGSDFETAGSDGGFPASVPLNRRNAVCCTLLFVLVVASVLRAVPFFVSLAAVMATLAIIDRPALKHADWGLLATFACFFIFAGNLSRIPELQGFLGGLMASDPLLTSAAASQLISNVPAAILLSHFTQDWSGLLVGVNIGGAGTPIASLASLITIREFSKARASIEATSGLPQRLVPQTKRFAMLFAALNFAFLAALIITCR